MSMPRFRHARTRIDWVILLAAALGATGAAHAKQSDKDQPLNLNAVRLVGSQQNGKLVVSGNVTMDQGTFHADGDRATPRASRRQRFAVRQCTAILLRRK